MIHTIITQNCTVFILSRELTRSAIYGSQHLSNHTDFIRNGYRTLFKDQLDWSKATCSFKAIGPFRHRKKKKKVYRFTNNLQGLQKVVVNENYGFILNTSQQAHDVFLTSYYGWFWVATPDYQKVTKIQRQIGDKYQT